MWRGADIPSDHHLLKATMKLRLKKHTLPKSTSTKYIVGLLRNKDIQNKFQVSISNRYQLLQDLEDTDLDIETHWQHIQRTSSMILARKYWANRSHIRKTGLHKAHYRNWISGRKRDFEHESYMGIQSKGTWRV